MWSPFLDPASWTAYLIPGLIGTLIAAAISVVLAIVFGILLGMGRLSQLKVLRIVCGAFVEFFRAVPVLMMMLFAYYFGLFVLQISGDALPLFGVIVGLTFYNSCVIAELVRSGVHSLPKGQREAGWAIGLTPTQTLTSVLLPQAITAMLPSIISQLVVILKDSALGYNIAYLELLRQGQNLATFKGNLIPTLIVLALIYIVINYGLTRIASCGGEATAGGQASDQAGRRSRASCRWRRPPPTRVWRIRPCPCASPPRRPAASVGRFTASRRCRRRRPAGGVRPPRRCTPPVRPGRLRRRPARGAATPRRHRSCRPAH